MPITISCPQCNERLKVAEEHLGKHGKCPQCSTVIDLVAPASAPAAAAAAKPPPRKQPVADWYVDSHDGNQYGPVAKTELDTWVADGVVTAECRLAQDGDHEWQPATAVYPRLAATASTETAAGDARVWNVIDSVNLFHTGIGVCDWQIHLCKEGIVATPEGMKNAVAAGVAGGMVGGAGGVVASPLSQALLRGGPQQIVDQGDPKWMRFPLDAIQSITVQKKLVGSRIFVDLIDGTQQKFASDNISATHQARYVISTVYGDLYREQKFKKPFDLAKAHREEA